MTSYVAAELRRLVVARANRLCEYCLIHEDETYLGCQVEHVVAEKHHGVTEADNLAFACTFCNRAKGTDIGSIAPSCGEFVRFFNPRSDHWATHFRLHDAIIEPLTPIGEATAKILRFNDPDRIAECELLGRINRYPPHQAAGYLAEGQA